ncbi:MAG TPA: LppP/LprE family lipoprotein [Mycobacterium sp.]|nr:LppP/LprE family lipoprotein [Mycobacterium sp.]
MVRPITALAAAALLTVTAGCGSGDSTVAKTPQATGPVASPSGAAVPSGTAPAPGTNPPPPDPCPVNLAAPAIVKAVSELPRDPRSKQPWNPEPLAGNYNQCAELSAVIVQANTNTKNPSTRAVLFHRGQYIPQSAPDTYGFNGIDLAHCTADTVALQHPIGVRGLNGIVKFHWNGTGVEIIANTAG